jgi:predicted nucleic acid-binding protein
LHTVRLASFELAIEAAQNFRRLRALGFTVCKTIDTVIATRCIVNGLELLHSDRDFYAFEQQLGLRCVRCES